MNKKFNKFYIVLAVACFLLLTACHASEEKMQEDSITAYQFSDKEMQESASDVPAKFENEQELPETTIEQNDAEELIEGTSSLDFELPNDVFVIEISRNHNDNQKVLALKDEFLQLWLNQTMICEKKIPVPAKVSIGSNFYEVIGNPYISEDGSLVLIQSYTTPKGEQRLDYTILAKNCIKIIPSLVYDGYVFQNYEGKYGLAFYRDNPSFPWYPYEGFGFNTVDSNFSLPIPTIIWLNESTVKSVKFGSWGSTSYGYQDISAISVRLEVESYGELDIAQVCDSFEPVEVDDIFFDLLYEKFSPNEYNERFSKVIQTINEYKQNR